MNRTRRHTTQQRVQCRRKERFRTATAAREAMLDMLAHNRRRKTWAPSVYRCRVCGGWHWGHSPTAKAEGER